MSINLYSASKLNRLRSRASKALRVPDNVPAGWSKSFVDVSAAVTAFEVLRVKPGYILRAYQFREGGNGNGVVWAFAKDAPFPEPDDCPRLTEYFLSPPSPSGTLPDTMDAIEGDGSPWSYLCASVLQRELEEFGARWHGCNWGTHTILGNEPFKKPNAKISTFEESADDVEWTWKEPRPSEWKPTVTSEGSGQWIVRFITTSALGQQCLILHTDRYENGGYRCHGDQTVLATGPGGFVF